MTLKPPKQFLRYLAVLLFSGGVALLTLGCIMIGRVRLPLPTDKSIDKRDQSSGWGHSGHPWVVMVIRAGALVIRTFDYLAADALQLLMRRPSGHVR